MKIKKKNLKSLKKRILIKKKIKCIMSNRTHLLINKNFKKKNKKILKFNFVKKIKKYD